MAIYIVYECIFWNFLYISIDIRHIRKQLEDYIFSYKLKNNIRIF